MKAAGFSRNQRTIAILYDPKPAFLFLPTQRVWCAGKFVCWARMPGFRDLRKARRAASHQLLGGPPDGTDLVVVFAVLPCVPIDSCWLFLFVLGVGPASVDTYITRSRKQQISRLAVNEPTAFHKK